MSDFTERQWAKAGRKARARSEAMRRPIREAVKAAAVKGLQDIRFASATAQTAASYHGLSWVNFEGKAPSSSRGFTAADVRKIAGVD